MKNVMDDPEVVTSWDDLRLYRNVVIPGELVKLYNEDGKTYAVLELSDDYVWGNKND